MIIAIALVLVAAIVSIILIVAVAGDTKAPERQRIPLGSHWIYLGSYTAISPSTNASLHVKEDGKAILSIAGNLIMYYDSPEEATGRTR